MRVMTGAHSNRVHACDESTSKFSNRLPAVRSPAAPLVASSSSKSTVTVDLSKLQGLKPLAVKLAWVLFDAPDQSADTCCPGHAAQNGLAVCLPGNCPLYSETSELPANPFYAAIGEDGKCKCLAPQTCDA